MDDAGRGRHDAEIAEGLLAPFEELVAFLIAFEFFGDIFREGLGGAEKIRLDRMVDHKVHGLERIDLFGIAAHLDHGFAHRGKVDDRRDAGKILQKHAGRRKGDLMFSLAGRVPGREPFDVTACHVLAVFVPEQVFEEHADGIRQFQDLGDSTLLERAQAIDRVVPRRDLERDLTSKTVQKTHLEIPFPGAISRD